MTLFVFNFDIFGIDFKEFQKENIDDIIMTLFVFHFDIFGIDFKELQ